jgi:hypothetical protein
MPRASLTDHLGKVPVRVRCTNRTLSDNSGKRVVHARRREVSLVWPRASIKLACRLLHLSTTARRRRICRVRARRVVYQVAVDDHSLGCVSVIRAQRS